MSENNNRDVRDRISILHIDVEQL